MFLNALEIYIDIYLFTYFYFLSLIFDIKLIIKRLQNSNNPKWTGEKYTRVKNTPFRDHTSTFNNDIKNKML